MDTLATLIVDNGISVGSFIALLYFIFYDKKQTNAILTAISGTLTDVQKSLVLLNERVAQLEEKREK